MTQDGATSFGELLRDLRLAAGLSQEMLAERARMSAGGISVLERGIRRSPNRDTLAQLADGLALSAADRERLEAAAARPQQPRRRKAAATVRHNLPTEPTSFIGREEEIREIAELIGSRRLVTLVGPGGVGKTRLASRVGADLLDGYPDGVWFVDLAPIDNPELVASVVAQAIGMTQQREQRVDESIPRWLKRKKLLLILDNCEHVLEPIAALAATILATAQDVRIVATSRQALNIGGEAVHSLPPLAVPAETAGLKLNEALRYEAVALFVDRARAADTRFTLTDDNAPIVADICRRLDGIPLAIELAAARVKILSIPNLAQRLRERFKILTGGSRTALPRQKTLGALIDWSYNLLTPQEQLLFSRVGIFAGGFGLDAATALCGDLCHPEPGRRIDEIDTLNLLASLSDKSLVVADTAGEHERFHMLESTRAYALEKLTATGARERLARRHAEYFCDRAQEADNRAGIGSTAAWLASVERELDNYRAVLEWALKDGRDPALGGAVAGALSGLWRNGGLAVEGRYWIGLAQASLDESMHPQVAARLWRGLGALSSGKRAHDCAQRALALYQSAGNEKGQARALSSLAFSLYQMGRLDEAGDVNARALAAMRALADKLGVADCLNVQAIIQRRCGDVAAARELYAQSLAAYKALGNEPGAALVLANLAELEFGDGRVEQAVCFAGEGLEIGARGKNVSSLAVSYLNIAAYLIALDDVDGAREAALEGLRLGRQAQHGLYIAIALQHLALLVALRGEVNDATRLIGYVNGQYKELGSERQATEKWGYENLMTALHEQLSEAQIRRFAAEGATWTEDQAVEAATKGEAAAPRSRVRAAH